MRTKLLRKIFNIFTIIFTLLIVLTISKNSNNILRTDLELEDITNLATNNVYLLNKNNQLVKTKVFIDSDDNNEIENIIKYLIKTNNQVPSGLNAYIPKKTKLLDYEKKDGILSIDLSSDFTEFGKNKQVIITGLVFSLLELDDVENVKIMVEGKELEGYNKLLNKNIGINNEFLFNSRYDLNKVVVFYIDKINNENYYVPVTKYLNDTREKIEIIIDELKIADDNLISYLNDNVELLDYREEGDVLYLNFNKYLVDGNENISKETLNTVAYSVFENYDVNVVYFECNSKKVDYVIK